VRKILLVAAALAVVAAAALAPRWSGLLDRLSTGRGARNLLLISIDTLRADRLGSHGYDRARTPALDGLAARGLRFAQATTTAPLTLPAHASLLTGTFPAYHGVRDNGGFYLGDDQATLAEILKARGFRTGGFVGAFVLDARWGIAQGFDRYFDEFDLSKYQAIAGLDAVQRPANEVVDKAIEWIDRGDARPFVAWVHLYDPHAPYTAPEPFRSRFPATLNGAYDAEVAWTDSQVGRLLDHLSSRDDLDRTLVVVVGDHGEALGEQREQAHGFFVYDATVHIPLLVAGPGVEPRLVKDQVRIVDVLPTLLELMRQPVPPHVQGRSLLPLARGERLDLLALSETWYPRYHYGWSELTAVRDGRYKFVAAPRRELYDTEADPGETHDLAPENPRRADALEKALAGMMTATTGAAAATAPETIDPEAEERLRALGYVGSSVSRRNLEDRPRGDPKDKIGLYNLLKNAAQDSMEGRIDEAIATVREALASDPEIVDGYTMLGNLHVKAKRHADAVQAYQRALSLDPEHQGAAFSLALTYKQMDRLADAEAGFERARQLDPRSGKAHWQLADIWMQRGDFARAEGALTAALSLNVDRPAFLVKLGECYIELKRHDEAEKALHDALTLKPDLLVAHYDLGLVYEARGEHDRAIAEYETERERNPKAFRASFNLARLLSGAGRRQEAVARFRDAIDANPEFGAGHLYLAKALLDLGDLRASEAAALKGLSSNPGADVAPLGHYVLADVYTRLGRSRDAAQQAAIGQRLERKSRP
jgi:arylsulfatase A-like enzyme/Tfp pilus assembly protein PilF